MAQKTRLELIDDLELRLSRLKPSNDTPFTKALLGNWIDQARDSFISDKLRAISTTNATFGGVTVEVEEKTISVDNLIGTNRVQASVTLSKPPLYQPSAQRAEPAIISAVVNNFGNSLNRTKQVANMTTMASNKLGNLMVFGGVSGKVYVSRNGGVDFISSTMAEVDTVKAVMLFNTGEIWVQMATNKVVSTVDYHVFYKSTDYGVTWTEYLLEITTDADIATKAVQPKDGSVAAMYVDSDGTIQYIDSLEDGFTLQALAADDFESTLSTTLLPVMVSKSIIWVAGDDGSVHLSTTGLTDQGGGTAIFNDVSVSGITGSIVSADFASEYEGAIWCSGNAPYWTMNGGSNWTEMSLPFTATASSTYKIFSKGKGIFFISANVDIPQVWKTTDYGEHWTLVSQLPAEAEQVIYSQSVTDIFSTLSSNGYLFQSYAATAPIRNNIKVVQPGFIDKFSSLRFANPSATNPVMYREGSSTKFIIEGQENVLNPLTSNVRVMYIAEAQSYADNVAYPIDVEDIMEVLQMAKEIGMEALGIPQLSDELNDGKF